MISIVGAFAEAWDEVRVNKSRFILSLVGVFLAVFALTTVHALGQIGINLMQQESEKYAGRPGTVQVGVSSQGSGSLSVDETTSALRDWATRIEASHYSLESRVQDLQPTGLKRSDYTNFMAVDASYATIHRLQVGSGRWLQPSDVDQLAPRIVVNATFAKKVGIEPPLRTPTKVELTGQKPISAVVVGITRELDPELRAYMSFDQAKSLGLFDGRGSQPDAKIWVDPSMTEDLIRQFDGTAASAPNSVLYLNRGYSAGEDIFFKVLPWLIRIAGFFALGLASLGVISVGIVTVRNRIREIGVRRSFGATGRRIFAAILLESVVASFVAGGLGVLASIALLRTPWPMLLSQWVTLESIPPFPLNVAIEGLVYASLIGAAAGIIPATMAIRAKVIEAIRF